MLQKLVATKVILTADSVFAMLFNLHPLDFRDQHLQVLIFALLEACGIPLVSYQLWCRRQNRAQPLARSLDDALEQSRRWSNVSRAVSLWKNRDQRSHAWGRALNKIRLGRR